jgi:hypothetical protein
MPSPASVAHNELQNLFPIPDFDQAAVARRK